MTLIFNLWFRSGKASIIVFSYFYIPVAGMSFDLWTQVNMHFHIIFFVVNQLNFYSEHIPQTWRETNFSHALDCTPLSQLFRYAHILGSFLVLVHWLCLETGLCWHTTAARNLTVLTCLVTPELPLFCCCVIWGHRDVWCVTFLGFSHRVFDKDMPFPSYLLEWKKWEKKVRKKLT